MTDTLTERANVEAREAILAARSFAGITRALAPCFELGEPEPATLSLAIERAYRVGKGRRAKRGSRAETSDYLKAAVRFITGAGKRVAEEGDEPELAELLGLEAVLAAAIQTAVDGQLARGRSWAEIALATGKTRQAAHKRWSGSTTKEETA